jgi:Transposase DDE domain group 1
VLDIDGTLVEVHSENNEGTAPTYKRGFGFHPMWCFADATGEALAARLPPGNAGANSVADHLGVLDDAVAQLPPEIAAGHRPGEGAGEVARAVVVCTDSAGCTRGFVAGCRHRNIGFAVVARSNRQVAARSRGPTPRPAPAVGPQRAARTARFATARKWPSSPTWSTPTGLLATARRREARALHIDSLPTVWQTASGDR